MGRFLMSILNTLPSGASPSHCVFLQKNTLFILTLHRLLQAFASLALTIWLRQKALKVSLIAECLSKAKILVISDKMDYSKEKGECERRKLDLE
jgi:hypothetical protein